MPRNSVEIPISANETENVQISNIPKPLTVSVNHRNIYPLVTQTLTIFHDKCWQDLFNNAYVVSCDVSDILKNSYKYVQ